MKYSKFCPLAGVALLTLSGCATPQWQKPGSTPAQLQADQSQCDATARLQVPQHIVATEVSGGSFNPGASQCGNPTNTDDSQCYNSASQWHAPTYVDKDVNAEARQKNSQACMIKKGWQLD